MIGIVVVSHSCALGNAAAELACEMLPVDARPPLRVAAGLDETTLGTDATQIADAITAVAGEDGVLVLVDIGSALLSAEMALEFVDPEVAAAVKISPAPLVEGLIAAVVTAGTGAGLDEVAAEAARGLVAKQEQLGEPGPDAQNMAVTSGNMRTVPVFHDAATFSDGDVPVTSGDTRTVPARLVSLHFSCTVRNQHGLHARPAANLVAGLRGLDATIEISNATTGKGPVPATSLTSIQTLGLRPGDRMEAAISGPQAELAYARLVSLAHSDFGEGMPATSPVAASRGVTKNSGAAATKAVGGQVTLSRDPNRTGRQIAIGPARHLPLEPDISTYAPGDPSAEQTRLTDAITQVAATLHQLAHGVDQAIYEVQQLILSDEETQDGLRDAIRTGVSAVQAVQDHFTTAAAELEAIDDPYLRARAEDQRGVQRMLLRALTGQDASPRPADGILILAELDPVTAGSLDPDHCQGIITLSGGSTGHGSLVAQARGFALVTGQTGADSIEEGTTVAIDPVDNQLYVDPSPAQVADLERRQAQRITANAEASRLSGQPATTKSGVRVLVEANLSSVQDAADAQANGAEGAGLVRTEVLFGAWDHAPTAEEQADLFVTMGKALGNQLITIRTWDPGGDKPMVFLPQDREENPMLGERGIRATRRLPHLLDEQLTAILLAARETPVRVMFPMIDTYESMAWARERLDEVRRRVGGEVPAGMMVETPAAAIRAADFRDIADFISVGTNDLTQYTMAFDRGNARIMGPRQRDISAVWDLIGMAARAFAGRPVAVCGDMASNPDAVARLIGLGVTELSVRPPLVGAIKQAVRSAD